MKNLFKHFSVSILDIILVLILMAYSASSGINTRKIIGGVIAFIGIGFWLTARYQLGTAFSVKPVAKMIVKTGIYKKIKHPIYLSSIITGLGGCIMFNIWWLYGLWGLLVMVQFFRARTEEKKLLDAFKNEYVEYKKTTWI
jgi:protein-S-isoprenylcysteine O-methyltransferase Ste14